MNPPRNVEKNIQIEKLIQKIWFYILLPGQNAKTKDIEPRDWETTQLGSWVAWFQSRRVAESLQLKYPCVSGVI